MKRYLCLTILFFAIISHGQNLALDSSFGTNGLVTNNDQIDPRDGIFENNQYYLFGNSTRFARYNIDGTKDFYFGTYGFFVFSIAGEYPVLKNFKMHNGKCYGFGQTSSTITKKDGIVVRLTTNGQLDPTFGSNGVVRINLGNDEYFNDILINADGSFYALGVSESSSGSSNGRVLVCKFLENGTLDTSFNTIGSKVFPYPQRTHGINIFNFDNTILLGNYKYDSTAGSVIYLQKIDTNGNLITNFGTNSEVVINFSNTGSGSSYQLKLVGNRLFAKFYWGFSFNNQGYRLQYCDINDSSNITTITNITGDSYFKPMNSGKLIITRGLSCPWGTGCYSTRFTVRQYDTNGNLDNTFDSDGVYEYDFSSPYEGATFVYPHDDGKLFIAGSRGTSNDNTLVALRLAPVGLNVIDNKLGKFSIYPNPASQSIFINNTENKILKDIIISDISGKKIETYINLDNSIDISKLVQGIYFLIFTVDGNYYSLKFVKS